MRSSHCSTSIFFKCTRFCKTFYTPYTSVQVHRCKHTAGSPSCHDPSWDYRPNLIHNPIDWSYRPNPNNSHRPNPYKNHRLIRNWCHRPYIIGVIGFGVIGFGVTPLIGLLSQGHSVRGSVSFISWFVFSIISRPLQRLFWLLCYWYLVWFDLQCGELLVRWSGLS